MKNVIYYFSGTGNNLAIAKQLASHLTHTDIFPIRHLLEHKTIPTEYTWVGFLAPSYYSHVPPFVTQCMENLIFADSHKIFTIVGCGGNRGIAHLDMREKVEECGKKVQLEYMITLPGSYILSYGAFPDWYIHLTTSLSNKKIHKIAQDILSDSPSIQLKNGILYNEKHEPHHQESITSYNRICQAYTVHHSC